MADIPQPYIQKMHAQVNKFPKRLNTQYLFLMYLIPIALIRVYNIIIMNTKSPPISGLSKNAAKKTKHKALKSREKRKLFLAYHLQVDNFSIRM